jgi:hypothetical protein
MSGTNGCIYFIDILTSASLASGGLKPDIFSLKSSFQIFQFKYTNEPLLLLCSFLNVLFPSQQILPNQFLKIL